MKDPLFLEEWNRLFCECGWSTVFQSVPFVTNWYSVYRECYEPFLIVGRGEDHELTGLLLLAMDRNVGQVVCAGTHHAEYHTWLSASGDADHFIENALAAASKCGARGTLHFPSLAPSTPIAWCDDPSVGGVQTSLHPKRRPLLDLANPDEVEASVKRKDNTSRLARLKQLGEVELRTIHSSSELEPILNEIVAQHDLRQAAVHRSTPFKSDPLKKEYYLRMMDCEGLLHATALIIEDIPVATHIGVINGSSVVLGLITHSPFYTKFSPGDLLVLLLAKLLEEQGYGFVDLTPGRSHEDRFATDSDTVYMLEVFFSRREHLSFLSRRATIRGARKALLALKVNEKELLRSFAWLRARLGIAGLVRLPVSIIKLVGRKTWSAKEFCLYQVRSDKAFAEEEEIVFQRNSIADLLCYSPAFSYDPSSWEFWRKALRRLEEGQIVYTFVDSGHLLHYGWLIPETDNSGTEFGHRISLPNGSAVLWDDFTHPTARGRGLHQRSIRARLREVATMTPPRFAYSGIRADNAPSRHNYEKMGFQQCAPSAWIRYRFGRVSRWLDGDCPGA